MDQQSDYRIVVYGELSRRWVDWFDNFDIRVSQKPGGATVTILSGPVVDQAALRGMLCKLWDLNLTVISVGRMEEERQGERSQ